MAVTKETCKTEFGCKGPDGKACLKAAAVGGQTDLLGIPNVLHISKPEFLEFLQRTESMAKGLCVKPEELAEQVQRGRQVAETTKFFK